MSAPSRDTLGKFVFGISLIFIIFLYGYASRGFGWFPNSILDSAWRQAIPIKQRFFALPPFVSGRIYFESGARLVEPGKMQPGFTLISSNWKDFKWLPGLKLIDKEGRVVHSWRVDPTEIFPEQFLPFPDLMQFNPITGSYLFPNGDILFNLPRTGTARLDACGEVVWRLPVKSHHSIHRDDDGSFWISGTGHNNATKPHPLWGGDGPGPVLHDVILHVASDGTLLEEIDVLDLLQRSDSLLPYAIKFQQGRDPTHLNDVEPLSASMANEYPLFDAGDLLVSLKHLNLVFVFDPENDTVKWHAGGPFIQQHDPDYMGEGWIGIFDNHEDGTDRGTRLGGSRIVAFEPHTGASKTLFPTARADSFYTRHQGTWQRLSNGNLLLTESRAGRVVEVAPDGRTVWEWIHEPYNDSLVAEVYQSERYDFPPQKVASWPCSPDSAS